MAVRVSILYVRRSYCWVATLITAGWLCVRGVFESGTTVASIISRELQLLARRVNIYAKLLQRVHTKKGVLGAWNDGNLNKLCWQATY